MSKILKTHPKSVQSHKDLVLQCLEDKDESIRLRALDLLYGMVSKKNLMEIVKKLMVHMDKAEGTTYRDELLSKIILICSQNNYQFITNFEWYITVLVELSQMEFGTRQGHVIATQLMDVCIRVQAIRHFAVNDLAQLLEQFSSVQLTGTVQEVLYAAAWLCGEFCTELFTTEEDGGSGGSTPERARQTVEFMLVYKNLPPHIQAVFIQNILKITSHLLAYYQQHEQYDALVEFCDMLSERMEEMIKSAELEVQERASTSLMLIQVVKEEMRSCKYIYIYIVIILLYTYTCVYREY